MRSKAINFTFFTAPGTSKIKELYFYVLSNYLNIIC